MIVDDMPYESSVDGTHPLLASVAFRADGKAKPIIAVMHGYISGREAVAQDIRDLAKLGFFCIAPDMRGRGKSGGKWDSGGLDVHDIVDAILTAIREYPSELNRANINIIGYSGGGGNVLSALTRFPDLFHVGASFFGISDYGLWYETAGRTDCNEIMKATLGGAPSEVPEVYAARNACLAAGNNHASKIHLFWDEEEKQCPPILNKKFVEAQHAAGVKPLTAHVSRAGDKVRWLHGYRTDHPMLVHADAILAEDIQRDVPSLALPHTGMLVVCGYVVTRHFQVFVEDGRHGVVKVHYEFEDGRPEVRIMDNPKDYQVHISMQTPTGRILGVG